MKNLRKPMRSLRAGSLAYPNLGNPDSSHKDSGFGVKNAGEIAVLVSPDPQEGRSLYKAPLTAASLGDIGSDVDTTGSGATVDRDVAPLLYDLTTEDTGEGTNDPDLDDVEEPPLLINADRSPVLADEDDLEEGLEDHDVDEIYEEEEDVDPADDLDLDLDEDEVLDPEDDEDEDEEPVEARVSRKAVARRQHANVEDLEDAIEDGEMALVDVDEMEEEVDASSVCLASVDNRVLVLHRDRVIASMDEGQAVKAGVEDEMHSQEFAAVVANACQTQGLRRGLSEMGFVLAKVNTGASHVVNRKVEARAEASTRALKASLKERERGFTQCMALAAVGLNKGYWKDVPNTLRPAIEAQLLHAGVQNPKAVTARIFAEHGVQFSRAIVVAAQRLADMPETARNVLAEALDFTTDMVDDIDDEIDVEEATTVDVVDGEDGDFEDITSTSITAALSNPGRANRGALLTPGTKVTAKAILAQDQIDFI